MNGRNLYALGIMIIVTGVLGATAGVIVGAPGSAIIGTGLAVSAVWMLYILHEEEER